MILISDTDIHIQFYMIKKINTRYLQLQSHTFYLAINFIIATFCTFILNALFIYRVIYLLLIILYIYSESFVCLGTRSDLFVYYFVLLLWMFCLGTRSDLFVVYYFVHLLWMFCLGTRSDIFVDYFVHLFWIFCLMIIIIII